jgi:type I restriction-modification system DNA methylase subunit
MSFLSSWQHYLQIAVGNIHSSRNLIDLYEEFIGRYPEFRKEAGVYYTPPFVVDYIVANTLGKKIQQIEKQGIALPALLQEVAKIKIIDPSCGSGSFLLGAYQYLLAYYQKWYEMPLPTEVRQQILVHHIFGVDIDAQAVEVAKLSLWIKCFEHETSIEFTQLQTYPLENNMRCGNALVSTDFYQQTLFTIPSEMSHIKAFDWKQQFANIFEKGGFDVVIGNPPYVLLQSLEIKEIFQYALKRYKSAKYKIDTYHLFMEKSLELLAENGVFGYITPNTFLKNIHAEPIRRVLLENTKITEIALFSYAVFNQASVDTCLLFFEKTKKNQYNKIEIKKAKKEFELDFVRIISQDTIQQNSKCEFTVSMDAQDINLLTKIQQNTKVLGEFCGAYFGIQTFDREKYVSSKAITKEYKLVIDGGNIEPYFLSAPTEFVKFVPEAIKSGGQESYYLQDRICIRQIGKVPIATIVQSGIYCLNTVYSVYNKSSLDLAFILAIINSKITHFFWQKAHSDEKATFPKIKKEAILSIPIPDLDLKHTQQKDFYDKIVFHAKQVLDLYPNWANATTTPDKDQFFRRIKYVKNEIDKYLYEFYNLSQTELDLIESI